MLTVTRSVLGIITICTVSAFASPASAFNSYLSAFNSAYPTSTLSSRMTSQLGSACYICHQPPNTSAVGNCYKVALAARLNAGRTIAQAIADIATADSDNDGVSNQDEIRAVRTDLPGQVGYSPGLIGATGTDPCATSTTAPVTNVAETPPPPCRADFNNAGGVTVQDIFDFLSAWFANVPSADFNNAGGITVQDIFDYLSAWFTGC